MYNPTTRITGSDPCNGSTLCQRAGSTQSLTLAVVPSSHLQKGLSCGTSAGDALLVDLTEVSDAALVGAGSHTLPIHRGPAKQSRLRDGKLLHDA